MDIKRTRLTRCAQRSRRWPWPEPPRRGPAEAKPKPKPTTTVVGHLIAFNDFHGAIDPPTGSGGLVNGTPGRWRGVPRPLR